jgi:class 3 adenylate cyclase/tetratricopeptide (TPR) repeat protein
MQCGRCATQVLAGKAFCQGCGLRVRENCPSCGLLGDPDWRFCPDCGSTLSPPQAIAPSEAERRLQAHIPPALAERIRSAGIGRGERKQVTVFFCDLVGSTEIAAGLDPEQYRELLDQYLERVFAEIYRVEGIVNQLAGDGLMALFGAPLSHGDDPLRAVRAALAVQAALAELSQRTLSERGFALRARIGIHTGTVVVGTVGNDLKMDYTAVGDTTNLAARLQELAEPGAVWLSETTERLVRGRFLTESLGPIQIRGRDEPVEVFRALASAPARTHMAIVRERGLTPFVGREAELAQLEDCFRRLALGSGQVVSLVGDAGSGKSRLVWELKQRIKGQGAALFEARCSALIQSVPYAPWERMLERYVGVEPGDSPDAIAHKLSQLRGTSEATLPYLRHPLGLPAPELAKLHPDVARQQAFEAFKDLVRAAASRGPVMMIIEELHWIDDASLEMLRSAALEFHKGPVMLLVTHRPEYEPRLRTRAAQTRLHLAPFGPEEGAAILRAAAGGNPPPELSRRILAQAEGNPFYIEELTRALLDDGTLERVGDGELVITRAVEDVAIPDTVQEVLAARLDRLRPSAKRVAQIAAVLGREFAREQLERMFEREWIEPEVELHELERQGILHRKAQLSESVYRFGESLTQGVAYESLLLSERRELHGRAARIIEESMPLGDLARLALVAHHWARSHERRRGAESLVAAAAIAEELPAYGSALRLFAEAWDLIEELLAEHPEPDPELVRLALQAARGVGMLSVIHGSPDPAAALRATERGEALAEQLGDVAVLAMIRAVRGIVVMAYMRERYPQGLEQLEGAIELAEAEGLERLVASMARPLALAYALDGRLADARRCIELAIRRLVERGEGDPPSDTYLGARFFEARILLQADALDEAEAVARDTHRQAVERNNRTIQGGTAALIAQARFERADLDDAERWAEEAIQVGAAIGSHVAELTGQAVAWGAVAERGSRPGFAAFEWTEHATHPGSFGAEFDLLIDVLLSLGEVSQARRFARLNERSAAGGMREASSRIASAEVQLASDPPELDAAVEALREAEAWAERFGSRRTRARALLGLARAARARGVTAPAEALEAARLFEALGFERRAREARELAGLERSEANAALSRSSGPSAA